MSENTTNIFEQATRQMLRFDTPAHTGLTVEQLWQLPLQTARANQSDLDGAGRVLLKALRNQEEESLITPANTGIRAELQLKLEIVKYIIGVKQAENVAKAAAIEREQGRARLMQILATKRADALGQLSVEEIEARLQQLDAQ